MSKELNRLVRIKHLIPNFSSKKLNFIAALPDKAQMKIRLKEFLANTRDDISCAGQLNDLFDFDLH
jgi:hypothetical protein